MRQTSQARIGVALLSAGGLPSRVAQDTKKSRDLFPIGRTCEAQSVRVWDGVSRSRNGKQTKDAEDCGKTGPSSLFANRGRLGGMTTGVDFVSAARRPQ